MSGNFYEMDEDHDSYKLEDDWFYDSIIRYKKLNMYELQNPIHLMELTDCDSICIVSSNKQGNFEISEFGLPNKITTDEEIVKDGDLKLKCGAFVPSAITQMKIMKGERKLITSRQQTPGVTLYNLALDSSTDEITKSSVVLCALMNPQFSLDEKQAILVTDTTNPAVLIDLSEGRTVQNYNCYGSSNIQSKVSPVFIDKQVFAVCYNNCGSLIVQDFRQDAASQFVPVSAVGGEGSWTVNSSYNCTENTQTPSKVIVVSDNGCLIVFDTRNWNTPVHQSKVKLINNMCDKDKLICVQFKASDSNCVSLSGCDGNVYVFDIADGAKEIFVHDGHRHVEGCDSNTISRSHMWLPYRDNYLISSALNRTVQCWEYEG